MMYNLLQPENLLLILTLFVMLFFRAMEQTAAAVKASR